MSDHENELLEALCGLGWVKPHEIGGTDSSHHSHTLRKLVKQGLVERRNVGFGSHRPTYTYRLVPNAERS